MRKLTFLLMLLLVLGSYGVSVGDEIYFESTIGQIPPQNVKGSKPAYVDLGDFSFTGLPEVINITPGTAEIKGTWSGNLGSGWGFGWGLGSNPNVSLYLGDWNGDPSDLILVATLTNQKKKSSGLGFWNSKKTKSIAPISWSYNFTDGQLEYLEDALDDGQIDFVIGGKPSKIKKVTLGATTLSFEDPPPGTNQLPNGENHDAVPEPATMLLLGSGLIGLAGYGRKKFFKK